MMPNPDRDRWWQRAACYRTADWRFHGSKAERREVADEYCAHCQVTSECETAGSGEGFGVWGGIVGQRH